MRYSMIPPRYGSLESFTGGRRIVKIYEEYNVEY